MFDVKRGENESYFDWKTRLIVAKIDKELDLDWIEIRDLLGEDCSPDHLRKVGRGIYEYHQELINNKINEFEDANILNEIEQKTIQLKEERKKLQTINVEYNRTLRHKSRFDLMWEEVRKSIEKIPNDNIEINVKPYKSSNDDKVAVLCFGDVHYGKAFKSINNEYSRKIAKKRMTNIINKVNHIINKEEISNMKVVSVGDSIEGMSLRISQLQALEIGFIDQTIEYSKFLSQWLNELSKGVENLDFHFVPSANHSEIRPFNTSRGQFPHEDLEKIIMHYTHDVLADNKKINIPLYDSGIIEFDIFDYNVMALHGHQIKGKKNIIKDYSLIKKKFYDYCLLGHYHHGNSLTVGENVDNNMEILQIPSVMGSDEYSDTLMTGSKAGAVLYVFEKGKGKTITYDLTLN